MKKSAKIQNEMGWGWLSCRWANVSNTTFIDANTNPILSNKTFFVPMKIKAELNKAKVRGLGKE